MLLLDDRVEGIALKLASLACWTLMLRDEGVCQYRADGLGKADLGVAPSSLCLKTLQISRQYVLILIQLKGAALDRPSHGPA